MTVRVSIENLLSRLSQETLVEAYRDIEEQAKHSMPENLDELEALAQLIDDQHFSKFGAYIKRHVSK